MSANIIFETTLNLSEYKYPFDENDFIIKLLSFKKNPYNYSYSTSNNGTMFCVYWWFEVLNKSEITSEMNVYIFDFQRIHDCKLSHRVILDFGDGDYDDYKTNEYKLFKIDSKYCILIFDNFYLISEPEKNDILRTLESSSISGFKYELENVGNKYFGVKSDFTIFDYFKSLKSRNFNELYEHEIIYK